MTAAEAHLAQLDSTRRGEGEGARNIRFVLRAPMSGIVAESDATPGASVEEGARLFRLVALDRVHIVGSLPEAALSRVDELVGAELEVPGFAAPVALDRLIAVGRVLDPDTRTVPIIYELRDPDPRLAIGQAVSLRVFVSVPPRRSRYPTAPSSTMRDSRSFSSRWPARASSDARSRSGTASRVWCRSSEMSQWASGSSFGVRRSSGSPPSRRRSRRTGTRTEPDAQRRQEAGGSRQEVGGRR